MLIEVLWFVLPLGGDLLNLYCTHSMGQTLKMGKANVLIIILLYIIFILCIVPFIFIYLSVINK